MNDIKTRMQDAEDFAEWFMIKHGLIEQGWTFRWNNRKRAYGTCFYFTKRIELSRFLFEAVDDDHVQDTILHEIAHALAGHTAGHGPKWKAIARELGAKTSATSRLSEEALHSLAKTSKYFIHCSSPECDIAEPRHKLTQHQKTVLRAGYVVCPKCRSKLNLTQNH